MCLQQVVRVITILYYVLNIDISCAWSLCQLKLQW